MSTTTHEIGDGSASPPTPRRARTRRVVLAAALVAAAAAAAAAVFGLDLHHLLTFDTLRDHRAELVHFTTRHEFAALGLFVVAYVLVTALALPGGAVLSVTGGFLFGGLLGGLVVIAGATAGATALFIVARSLVGDRLRRRAGPWLRKTQDGFRANALSYLLALRLVPAFPFFIVNIVPALLGVPLRTYVLATAVGIVPGTLVFTFAGAGIGSVLDSTEAFSPSTLATPSLLLALAGLAALSLLPVVYERYRDPARAEWSRKTQPE